MGAAVYFLARTRNREQQQIQALSTNLSSHGGPSVSFAVDQIEKRWPIESIRVVHRIGIIKVNEPSLWVEVIAPHRGEAFAACQWLIDEMKKVVPIWKKPLPTP
jgi:molybdopterin synthase catalytic subunit